MKKSELRHLTREEQEKWRRRLLNRLNRGEVIILLSCIIGLCYSIYSLREERTLQNKELGRLMVESAQKGCPVWTDGPGYIVVSGPSVLEVREQLGRIAHDLDLFHAKVNKAEKVKR